LQPNARGSSKRYHELKPHPVSDAVEITCISALSGKAEVPSLSTQLQNSLCNNPCLNSIASQPVSPNSTGDSDGTIRHTFFQGNDIDQHEYLSITEVSAAFHPGVDDPTFLKPTIPSPPLTNLEERGSATSRVAITSTNSPTIPSDNYISPVASQIFSPEAVLPYPVPKDVTSEREALENSMSLSLLPSNSTQVSTFYSRNSRYQSQSQVLNENYDPGLSTNDFENQGLELEAFSHTKFDLAFEGQAQTQINSMYLAMPSLLPGFHKPHPERSKLSPFLAYMHVAILLGITLQDLANDKHSSPFYRKTTAKDDPKTLLAAAAIPSLPAHLQQILFPHNSNLDLLPFPVLRARAITLAATTPQLINPKELKMDILRDGLICWYSKNNSYNGLGQPWDIQSWEAASWFKKKRRMLFDEEQDNYHL
jgi:hypothetical protein